MLSVACVVALGSGSLRAEAIPVREPGDWAPLPELDYEFAYVYSIETDKQVYQLGEEVLITHRAINEGEVSITLEFLYTPGFSFKVLRDGEEVWAPFVLCPGRYLWGLAPGESYVTQWTWDMNDSDGNPLAPGRYEILGIPHGGPSPIVLGGHYSQRPVTTITIVPEPGMVGIFLLSFCVVLRRKTR
jgi:hypothetical protein